MGESKYPEHEKLSAVKDQSQAIGEFLEWLESGDFNEDYGRIRLAYRPLITETPIRDHDFNVTGYRDVPRHRQQRSQTLQELCMPKTKLLAKFFGIDPGRLEAEKRQMLDEIRNGVKP